MTRWPAAGGRGRGAAGGGGDDSVGTPADYYGRGPGRDDPGALAGKHLFISCCSGYSSQLLQAPLETVWKRPDSGRGILRRWITGKASANSPQGNAKAPTQGPRRAVRATEVLRSGKAVADGRRCRCGPGDLNANGLPGRPLLAELTLRFGCGSLQGICLRQAQVEGGALARRGVDGDLAAVGRRQ